MRVRPTTRFGGVRIRRLGGAAEKEETTIITIDDDEDDDDNDHSSPAGHRTCRKARRRRPSKHQVDAIDKLKHTFPCYSGSFPSRLNSKSKFPLSRLNNQLTDKTFESHLENLWRSFPDDRRNSFVYINSLWFVMYLNSHPRRSKVLTWIKGKHIFSKKYIFIPIVRWGHWSLLIICHLGQTSESEYQEPCMLLLDSLQMTDPRRLEPDIRKFVLDIFTVEGRHADKQFISGIPLLVPKVPQQTNGVDCGIYVLFFIDLFVQHAPATFSLLDGYPYFMQENWFCQDNVEDFRAKLISLENPDEAHCAEDPLIVLDK